MGYIYLVDLAQGRNRWQEFLCTSKETNKLVFRCNHNCLIKQP